MATPDNRKIRNVLATPAGNTGVQRVCQPIELGIGDRTCGCAASSGFSQIRPLIAPRFFSRNRLEIGAYPVLRRFGEFGRRSIGTQADLKRLWDGSKAPEEKLQAAAVLERDGEELTGFIRELQEILKAHRKHSE